MDPLLIARARKEGASNKDLVKLYRGYDIAHEPPEFKVLTTEILTASYLRSGESETNPTEGDPVIKGTTSSTDIDLYGTRMTKKAINVMLKDCREHLTTFMNHDYEIPESLLGTVREARAVKRKAENGETYTDLDIISSVVPEDVNPRAMRCWKAIRSGVKLGYSIGALILDWEWQLPDGTKLEVDTDDPWAMYFPPTEDAVLSIVDVLLLESSIVGMPANRRSWITEASRSIQNLGKQYSVSRNKMPLVDINAKPQISYAKGDVIDTTVPEVRAIAPVGDLEYGYEVQDNSGASIATPPIPDVVLTNATNAPVTEEAVSETPVTEEVVTRSIEDNDPWDLVIRSLELALRKTDTLSESQSHFIVDAHDKIAHVAGMKCCGAAGCKGHDGEKDMSGRSDVQDSMHDEGTTVDVEYSAKDFKAMQREIQVLKDAGEHIMKRFTDEFATLKLNLELTKAEADTAKREIEKLNELPVNARQTDSTPVKRVADKFAPLSYEEELEEARNQDAYVLSYE